MATAADGADGDAVDPATLFIPGRVLSAHGPHGTVLCAAVVPAAQAAVGAATVAVKVLPVGGVAAAALRAAVAALAALRDARGLARYVGVWAAGPLETWVVSEYVDGGAADAVLAHAAPAELEAAVAYVALHALRALRFLHESVGIAHGDLRPANILLAADASVRLADYGVYNVLAAHLRGRQCYPGAKLWPAPPERGTHLAAQQESDLWALGAAVVEMVDGAPVLTRTRKSGRRVPRCARPGNWSLPLNQFVAQAALPGARAADLLRHRFVAGANAAIMRNVLQRARTQMRRPEERETFDATDVVGRLYRANCVAMRIPLILPEDIPVDAFCVHRQRRSRERPAIEQSLWLASDALKNLVDMGRAESKGKITESSNRVSQWLDIANRRASQ